MLVVLDSPREGAAGVCRSAVQCLWTSTAHAWPHPDDRFLQCSIRTARAARARTYRHTRSHNRCPNKEKCGRVRVSVSLQYAYLQVQVCACARACTSEQREVVINLSTLQRLNAINPRHDAWSGMQMILF